MGGGISRQDRRRIGKRNKPFERKKFESSNDPRYSFQMKNIDLKSLVIGFLLASVLLLGIGATSKTIDVRIVGIDKHYADWDPLVVQIKK